MLTDEWDRDGIGYDFYLATLFNEKDFWDF